MWAERPRDERGSALLLVPTGILVMLVLASITVDATTAFMAERSAASVASAAANDVASLALDVEHYRLTGEYRLSADRSARAVPEVRAAVETQLGALFEPGSTEITIVVLDASRVEVRVSGQLDRVLLAPLGAGPHRISARAVATADVIP